MLEFVNLAVVCSNLISYFGIVLRSPTPTVIVRSTKELSSNFFFQYEQEVLQGLLFFAL